MEHSSDRVDRWAEEQLKARLATGERPTIVAGITDYYGDGVSDVCDHCGRPVKLRPYLAKAVKQHGLEVMCLSCAQRLHPPELKKELDDRLRDLRRL